MNVDYPRAVLAVFAGIVGLGLLVAVSTSGVAFGTYNPSWDGTTDLRSMADERGTDTGFVQNASTYRSLQPDGTLAIVLSPDESYGDGDARAMRQFVANGGTLLVATDFGSTGNALLADVGASARVDGRPLRDEQIYGASPAFLEATNVSDHPLTAGVDRLTLNHGSSVTTGSGNVTTLVATSPFAYHDENQNDELDDTESVGSYPVATVEPVGDGQIIVVSDPSMFINTMLEADGNSAFATNLIGTHDRLMVDVSHASSLPPLAALLLSIRESAVVQLLLGGTVVVVVTRWEEVASVAQSVFDRRQRPSSTGVDREAIVAAVRDRHPEWESERIERVTRGIITTRNQRTGDD